MALDRDEQALLLLTNRLLMDWVSLAVDGGQISKEDVTRLIDFSAGQVIQGAPALEKETRFFADLSKERLPAGRSAG